MSVTYTDYHHHQFDTQFSLPLPMPSLTSCWYPQRQDVQFGYSYPDMVAVSKLETRLDNTDRCVEELRPPARPQPDPDPSYNQPHYPWMQPYRYILPPLEPCTTSQIQPPYQTQPHQMQSGLPAIDYYQPLSLYRQPLDPPDWQDHSTNDIGHTEPLGMPHDPVMPDLEPHLSVAALVSKLERLTSDVEQLVSRMDANERRLGDPRAATQPPPVPTFSVPYTAPISCPLQQSPKLDNGLNSFECGNEHDSRVQIGDDFDSLGLNEHIGYSCDTTKCFVRFSNCGMDANGHHPLSLTESRPWPLNPALQTAPPFLNQQPAAASDGHPPSLYSAPSNPEFSYDSPELIADVTDASTTPCPITAIDQLLDRDHIGSIDCRKGGETSVGNIAPPLTSWLSVVIVFIDCRKYYVFDPGGLSNEGAIMGIDEDTFHLSGLALIDGVVFINQRAICASSKDMCLEIGSIAKVKKVAALFNDARVSSYNVVEDGSVKQGCVYLCAFLGDEIAYDLPQDLTQIAFLYEDLYVRDVDSINHRSTSFDTDARLIPPHTDMLCLNNFGRVHKLSILVLHRSDPKSPSLVIFEGNNGGRCSTVWYAFDPGGDTLPELRLLTLIVASWFPP